MSSYWMVSVFSRVYYKDVSIMILNNKYVCRTSLMVVVLMAITWLMVCDVKKDRNSVLILMNVLLYNNRIAFRQIILMSAHYVKMNIF